MSPSLLASTAAWMVAYFWPLPTSRVRPVDGDVVDAEFLVSLPHPRATQERTSRAATRRFIFTTYPGGARPAVLPGHPPDGAVHAALHRAVHRAEVREVAGLVERDDVRGARPEL